MSITPEPGSPSGPGGFDGAAEVAQLGSELVPVPRPPDQTEQNAEQSAEVNPFIQVQLAQMIFDAAAGAGDRHERQRSDASLSEAVNYSETSPLRDQHGVGVNESVREFEHHYAAGTSSRGTIKARSMKNILGRGTHPEDDWRELVMETTDQHGQSVRTKIRVTYGKRGDEESGVPKISRFIAGQPEQPPRPLSRSELLDIKNLIGESFGLTYEPPYPRDYEQIHPGEYSEPATASVKAKIFELQIAGYEGRELRRALLAALSPDVDGSAEEEFKYANSLDLDRPLP